jgi:predicted ArsR family transcriptional regulator
VPEVHAPPDAAESFNALVALCDPARRDLYFYVAHRDDWVSRDEAADALGLRRGLVAHHLDRLAADGLLDVEYRRLTGRSGPGAGRPAKLYRRSDAQFALTVPPRNPNLVGELLTDAIGRAGKSAQAVRRALSETARESGEGAVRPYLSGRSAGARRRALADMLAAFGYSPTTSGGELSLSNCPYEPLSSRDRDLVCSMNLALVEGAASGGGLRGVDCSLRLPTGDGGCCVRVRPWPESGG